MKKIGRFKKNIVLIKYHNVTFQSGLVDNTSFTIKNRLARTLPCFFLTRIFSLTNASPLKAFILIWSVLSNEMIRQKQHQKFR